MYPGIEPNPIYIHTTPEKFLISYLQVSSAPLFHYELSLEACPFNNDHANVQTRNSKTLTERSIATMTLMSFKVINTNTKHSK